MTNLKNSCALTLLALLSVLTVACGKTLHPEIKPLDPITPFQKPNEAENPDQPPPPPVSTAACDYWNGLPTENLKIMPELTQFSQTFQLADQMQLVPASGKTPAQVLGVHHIAYLPQVLFKLSDEYAKGQKLPRKSLDPMSVDEFVNVVREKYKKGEVGWIQKEFVEFKYATGDTNWLIKTRNEAIVSAFEEQLPGVFTGKKSDLLKSQLFEELYSSSSLNPKGLADNFAAFKALERRVALFNGENMTDVSEDMDIETKVLASVSSNPALPIPERICRFAIKSRLLAQILSIKGVIGVPRIQKGYLLPFPKADKVRFPTVDITGAYPEPLTADILAEQAGLKASTLFPRIGADLPENFLELTKLYSNLQKSRNSDLWALKAGVPPGQIRMPSELIPLILGLQVMSLGSLNQLTPDLDPPAPRLAFLRDDNADNLARLGQVAVATLDSVSGLDKPTALDLEVFTPEQIGKLATNADSLKVKMLGLSLLTGLEGLSRIDEGRSSPMLIEALHRIGYRIGSKRMTDAQ